MGRCEVVTFGETMVLFNPAQHMPLEYVHQFAKQIGGAESNVAIGLQRLGHNVGWFSKLGNDPFGRYINNFIRGEGVDTSRTLFTHDASTGIFFKEKRSAEDMSVFYYRKNSAASLLEPSDIDEDYIAGAKILHLTGITPALSVSCRNTVYHCIEIAKRNNVKIVFDPNIRLKLWSKEEASTVLRDLASLADVILPGIDEGEWITGEKSPEEIVTSLKVRDDQTIIVKLGAGGAYYNHQGESGYVQGYSVKQVVDPIGAGDGFAAGIISGLLNQKSIEETIRIANAIGAIVVGVNGDVEGLPRLEELERFMLADQNEAQDVKR
jgi:2-dehydro-3-deoxygluconokinase